MMKSGGGLGHILFSSMSLGNAQWKNWQVPEVVAFVWIDIVLLIII